MRHETNIDMMAVALAWCALLVALIPVGLVLVVFKLAGG